MKYTEATALAIKRDIQKMQGILASIIEKISLKRKELTDLELQISKKRTVAYDIENLLGTVIQKHVGKVSSIKKQHDDVVRHIAKLSKARDLLHIQISLQKVQAKKISLPPSVSFAELALKQLRKTLDVLTKKVKISELEFAKLESQKKNSLIANKNLKLDRIAQEARVKVEQQKLADIEKQRALVLKELSGETIKLSVIQSRERDSMVLHRRLSDDYQKVYNSLPRRNKK